MSGERAGQEASHGSGMGDFTTLGQPFSLHAIEGYCESPPAPAQFKVNGSTAAERMARLGKRARSAMRAKQMDRYSALLDAAGEVTDDADEALDLLSERVTAWTRDMRSGQLDPDEVLQNIAECPAVLAWVTKSYASVAGDADAAMAMINMDPADYQTSLLERFPALEQSLPVVTEAWLRGDPGAQDPLADPRGTEGGDA